MISKKPTAGVILAAGLSRRFGRPKPLMQLNGKPLIEWVVEASLNSRLAEIVVVLGPNAQPIAAHALKHGNHRIHTVMNPRYEDGMSRSLQAGLTTVMKTYPSVMFLLGDQPMVSASLIDRLLDGFWESDKDICVPVHRGRRGNPSLFSRRLYHQLMNVSGDIGAREIIQANPQAVLSVEVEDPLPFFDIDTEKDLEALRAILEEYHLN